MFVRGDDPEEIMRKGDYNKIKIFAGANKDEGLLPFSRKLPLIVPKKPPMVALPCSWHDFSTCSA